MQDASNMRIAVVGQGIIGLTSAQRLRQLGFSVHVFSKELFHETNSLSAGAYWWPHKVYPEHRVSGWAKISFEEYRRLQDIAGSGVFFQKHLRFCLDVDDSLYALDLVDEWERIDASEYGMACAAAFSVMIPVIDVPKFMPYLRDQLLKAGVEIHIREVESPEELFPEFDLVVNCTGVWASRFARDPLVYPIRGQIVRVSAQTDIQGSRRLYQNQGGLTLILPRSEDIILGGTSQEKNWSREPSTQDTQTILKECAKLFPEVKRSQMLGISVGLRPGRSEIRLELELPSPEKPIIHNYGHGGGGYTVAWGCADEVAAIAVRALGLEG